MRSSGGVLGAVRGVALIVAAAGAAGSVGLTLYTGRENHSRILMGLFVLWVLSPFAGLVVVNRVARSWAVVLRATLYGAMLVVTGVSLAIYGEVALGPPRAQQAFVFLVVPLASWLAVAMAVAIAGVVAGRAVSR